MHKRKILLSVWLLVSIQAFSQSNVINFKNQTAHIPPSPNSAGLAKYSEIPVSLNTGIPQIGTPIFQWKSKRGNGNLNVGLSYHAGGIKVEDVAPNTGLGWSLNAGGVITRSVRGLPDDDALGYINTPVISGEYNTTTYQGGYYLNPVSLASEYTSMDTSRGNIIAHFNDVSAGSNNQITYDLYTGFWDTEQDMFFYNFNGHSGKFVLDKDGVVNKIDQNDLEITVNYTLLGVSNYKSISSFIIQDDDGMQYTFDLPEESTSSGKTESKNYHYTGPNNVTFSYQNPAAKTMYSTYHLTKAQDLNSDDVIWYYYNNRTIKQIGGYNESLEYHENDDPDQLAAGIQTNSKRASEIYSYQFTETNTKQISSITLPDKKTIHFYYDQKREDLHGDSALTRVEVKDGFGNSQKFRLRYSYFDASNVTVNPNANVANWGPLNGNFGISGYDNKPEFFTHRLRLDKIQSVTDWENGDSLLISEFIYNDTILPPRNSKAIDYWGYYYGPQRFVNTFIPEIAPYVNMNLSTEGVIAPTISEIRLNDYCNGANRVPDPLYTRASVLKQIKMPTGGNTSFNLETNTIKGPVYHNSNKESSSLNTQIRKKASLMPEQAFSMPCRAQTSVLFYPKVKRVNNDGSLYVAPPPSPQSTCFENAVGNSTLTFWVKSTDGVVIKQVQINAVEEGEVEMYPVHFILPLGKDYVLYYTYDRTQGPCLEEAYFNITTRIVYTTDKNIDYVGGLRVSSIQHYDPVNNQTLKTVYNYDSDEAPQGVCQKPYPSSVLPSVPNFNSGQVRAMGIWADHFSDTSNTTSYPVFLGYATYKGRSSNSTQTLGYTGGSNVGYTKVSVSKVNQQNQPLGKTVSYFSGIDLKNEYPIYPYKVNQLIDWNSGQMLKEQVYDNTARLLKQTDYTYYTPVQAYNNDKNKSIKIVNIRSDNKAEETNTQIFYNRYLATSYYPYYGKSLLTKKIETDFENNETMVSETRYSYYNSTSNIVTVTTYNSKGEKMVSWNYYPQDFTPAAIQQLVTNKVTGSPIASKTTMPGVPIIGGNSIDREISGSGVDYEIQNGKARPKLFYQMATDNPLTITPFNPAQVKQANDIITGEVTLYDAYGNACEYKGRDGVIQTIIWGFNYTLPVAKITGIGYYAALAQMSSVNIDNLQQITDDATLRSKINEIRLANTNNNLVQVTTITYKPLIGVTSETDAGGRTIYYEYDAFHRLKLVRDKDQNIIKRYDYKYQATPNY